MKKVEGEKRSRGRKIVVLRVSSRRRASLFLFFLLKDVCDREVGGESSVSGGRGREVAG